MVQEFPTVALDFTLCQCIHTSTRILKPFEDSEFWVGEGQSIFLLTS